MAWLWWLLAPVLSTVVGALLLSARAHREARFSDERTDPMARHQQLLSALQRTERPADLPATMILLEPEPAPTPAVTPR